LVRFALRLCTAAIATAVSLILTTSHACAQGGAVPPVVAADGSVGGNTVWENGTGSFYIELQANNLYLIPNGMMREDESILDTGLNVYRWGFGQEAVDGSFPQSVDPYHSTNVFVLWAGDALYRLRGYQPLTYNVDPAKYPSAIAFDAPLLDRSANWLADPANIAANAVKETQYTHRYFLLAAALGYASALSNDPALLTQAHLSAATGVSKQLPAGWQVAIIRNADGSYPPAKLLSPGKAAPAGTVQVISGTGVDPEEGGFDVNYQCVSVLAAEQYYPFCTDPTLQAQLKAFIANSLRFEESRVSTSGAIDWTGSRRTGIETNVDGSVKTPNIPQVVSAFENAVVLLGDPTYHVWARRIDDAQYAVHPETVVAANGNVGANGVHGGASQNSTVGLTADAYVTMKTPTTPSGTGSTVVVKNYDSNQTTRIAYVKFDLSGVIGTINGASLRLFGSTANPAADIVSAYPVADTTWTEAGLTWNVRPPTGPTVVGSGVVSTTAAWNSIDIGRYVASEFAAGRKIISLAVKMDDIPPGNQGVSFNSREAGSNAPQVVVNYSPPSSPITLPAAADSYVYMKTPTTNYGTAQTVIVKNHDSNQTTRVAYLKFDLASIAFTAGRSTLSLYGRSANATADGVTAYAADNSWTEAGVNWNNRPSTSTTALSTATVPTSLAWESWDVTNAVAAALAAGQSQVTIALKMDAVPAADQGDSFNARESTSNRPQLTVTPATSGAAYRLGLQSIGVDWVEAGVRREDPALIQTGISILTSGMQSVEAAHAAGTVYGSYDDVAAFDEALARAGLLVRQYQPSTYTSTATTFAAFMTEAASDVAILDGWLSSAVGQSAGTAADSGSVSHILTAADALAEGSSLTSDAAAGALAASMVGGAVVQQDAAGFFTEPARDLGRQAVSILALCRYARWKPAGAPDVASTLSTALGVEAGQVGIDGSFAGNTVAVRSTVRDAFHQGAVTMGDAKWDVFADRVEAVGQPAVAWSEPLE